MVSGSLIHSKDNFREFQDVYGYLILVYLTIAEISLTRNLKNMIRASLEAYHKNRRQSLEQRASMMQDPAQMLADDRDKEEAAMNKFLIKIKDKGDSSPLNEGNRRRTSIGPFEDTSVLTYMRIEKFVPFSYDESFFKAEAERYGLQREQRQVVDKTGKSAEDRREDYMLQNVRIGKLLYYFENRDNYLNCKMFYGGIYLMFRMTFFILISISDTIDCLVSMFSLLYLCYYWYTLLDNPTSSVRALNKLAVVVICIKYLIGCLDIQSSNYSGDRVDFESSVVLIFLGSTSNKNYDYFKMLVGDSLSGYWLVFESTIFVAIQLLIYFYTIILQLNTVVIAKHIKKIQYMIATYINYHKAVTTRRPFYVNFNRWYSPTVKFAEMFLKIGTIYLPIFSIIVLLGFSQSYATLPIVAIVSLSLVVIYQLIFKWLYRILDQKDKIVKYFNWIKMLIWGYIMLGSFSRIFKKPIRETLPNYHPLGRITLVIVICLISFQIIIDLWNSVDFKRFYREFLSSNKLSQVIVPLCEAYEFNETKLKMMVSNLKSKESLDKRIRIMEKQLKIWHMKFASKEEQKNGYQEIQEKAENWEKEISDLDKEEENLILELRQEEYAMSQVGMVDKVLNYFFLTFLNQLKRFNFCPHLYLMNYIKLKNSEICKDIEFKIYDYISEEYDEYLDISNAILAFYKSKEDVKLRLLDLKDEEKEAGSSAKLKDHHEDPIHDKPDALLKQAVDIVLAKIQKPKEISTKDMTIKKKNDKSLLFFDAKVNEVTIRFYNITDMGSTDLQIMHRLSKLRKIIYVLYLFPSFILANFQGISLTIILAYCMLNPFPLKLVLLIHVIINGLTEETNLNREFWKKTFIILSGISWLKILIKALFSIRTSATDVQTYSLITATELSNKVIEFFFGNLTYETMEVLAFLFTILRILQAQFDGSFDKYFVEFENISEAYIRVAPHDRS